jgi:hypothetical protein
MRIALHMHGERDRDRDALDLDRDWDREQVAELSRDTKITENCLSESAMSPRPILVISLSIESERCLRDNERTS